MAALAGRWSNTECVEGCVLGIQRIEIFTLVERQMDITEGHRTFESKAICAELIGKYVVAIAYK